MNCELDHLVVVARTLEDGARWCEATLGVPPGPGGKHVLMGTHNRLLAIGSPAFPRSYLEIIAIDPDAPPPGRPRWFGLDDPALQAAAAGSPRLHHVVLRSPNITMMRRSLVDQGLDPGEVLAAERATPSGRLKWQILVRNDGRIEAGGTLPTLIGWEGPHPADTMTPSAVSLRALRVGALPSGARDVLRWQGPEFVAPPAPRLQAVFNTPRGEVRLTSLDA